MILTKREPNEWDLFSVGKTQVRHNINHGSVQWILATWTQLSEDIQYTHRPSLCGESDINRKVIYNVKISNRRWHHHTIDALWFTDVIVPKTSACKTAKAWAADRCAEAWTTDGWAVSLHHALRLMHSADPFTHKVRPSISKCVRRKENNNMSVQ